MSVTIRTCLIITCTRCGQVNDDFDSIHADTINEARAWFTDWQWSDPNTPDLCPGCVADLDCERDGHQWTPWRPAVPPGREHVRFRHCEHCLEGAVERDPARRPALPITCHEPPEGLAS